MTGRTRNESPDDSGTGPAPLIRRVPLESIRTAVQHVIVTPDAGEAKALAAFLGLSSIEKLKAVCRLSRNGERVTLKGEISADLHQICVVTLEPIAASVQGGLSLTFAPAQDVAAQEARLLDRDNDGTIDLGTLLDGDDLPEPIEGNVIDLGAAITEHLSLLLDPYPRKPDVVFAASSVEPERVSPFAALARLKSEP